MPIGVDAWLRPLTPADATDITRAVQDPEIIRFTRIPAPYDETDGRRFVASVQPEGAAPEATFAVAIADPDRSHGRLIGVVGLVVDPRSASAEIGYWIAAEGRGRGLVRRAAELVCAHGFDTLGLARIHLCATVDNPGSNAIAEALGFTDEGLLRAAHCYRDGQGNPTGRGDMRVWGLLPGELTEASR